MTKRIAIGLLVAGGLAGQTQVDLGRQVRNTLPYATGGTNGTSQITARANIGTPDLVATDFTGADLGAQVNAAFTSFGAGKCGTVAIPPGTFTYNTTIYVPSSCSLSGAGPGDPAASNGPKATRLIYTGAAATSALVIMNPDETPADYAAVRDLAISSGLAASCPNSGMLRWNAAAGGTNKWQCYDGTSFTAAVPHLAGIRHGNLNPTLLTDGTFIRIVNVSVDGSGTNWPSTYGAFHFGVMLNGCEECVLDQVRTSGADDGFVVGPATNGVLLTQATARFNKRSGISAHFANAFLCQNCLFESNGVSAPSSDPTKYGQAIRLADDDTGYGAGYGGQVFFGTYFEGNLVDIYSEGGEAKIIETVAGMNNIIGNFNGVAVGSCQSMDPTLITINYLYLGCSTPLPNENFVFPGTGSPTLLLTDFYGRHVKKIKARTTSGLIADVWEQPLAPSDQNVYIRTFGDAGGEGLRFENSSPATASAIRKPSAELVFTGNHWDGSASVKRSFKISNVPSNSPDSIEELAVTGPDTGRVMSLFTDHRISMQAQPAKSTNFMEWRDNGNNVLSAVRSNGMVQLVSVSQGQLGAPPNGTIAYCSDCNQDATCTASGGGALAKRIAGAWKCD